ncbi:MAG: hypothetical protein LBU47_03840, partial [Christensenellaceae bacterium]|nr:hypothetical protein [Christensenellaceae bacterium]
MKRKLVAYLLAGLMLALALSACSSPTPAATQSPAQSAETTEAPAAATEEPAGPERTPVSLTLLHAGAATSTIDQWHDTPAGKALAELTKVDLSIEYLVGIDVRQKSSLLIASGQDPDLINSGDASGDYYAAGALVPLDE